MGVKRTVEWTCEECCMSVRVKHYAETMDTLLQLPALPTPEWVIGRAHDGQPLTYCSAQCRDASEARHREWMAKGKVTE